MSADTIYKPCTIGHFLLRYWPWIAVFTVVLFTTAVRIRLLEAPLERDEGEYAYAGQLILRGLAPYDRLYSMKMPGIYFVYALILAAFGQTQTAIHTGLLLANLATIILLFLLAKKLFDPFIAVVTAAAFSILSISDSVVGIYAHAEHFVLLPAVAGLLLLIRAVDSQRLWQFLVSGLLFGTAFLIRQHGAAFGLFAVVYLLFRQLKTCRAAWAKVCSNLAIFCIAVSVPYLLSCLAFYALGILDKFWFWTYVYPRQYLSMVPLSVGMELLRQNASVILFSAPLLWTAAATGLIALVLSKRIRPQVPFVLMFLVFSVVSVCPGLFFRSHYFVLLLPAAALLIAIAAGALRDICRLRFARLAAVLPILLVLVAFGHSLFRQRNFLFRMDPVAVTSTIYVGNPFVESIEISSYIREHSNQSDRIAVVGSEPQIYFYSDRISATGYIYTYALMEPHPYAENMQRQMISEIESVRPKFIVFVNFFLSWLGRSDSSKMIFNWFNDYRRAHYDVVGVVDTPVKGPVVYRWGAAARAYLPSAKYHIVIFRLKETVVHSD